MSHDGALVILNHGPNSTSIGETTPAAVNLQRNACRLWNLRPLFGETIGRHRTERLADVAENLNGVFAGVVLDTEAAQFFLRQLNAVALGFQRRSPFSPIPPL